MPDISFNSGLNTSKIFNGNTVTINYSVGNTGTVPVSGVGIIDDKAGTPAYLSGDADSDTTLDPGETWMYKADYTIPAGVSGVVTATAIVSFPGCAKKAVYQNRRNHNPCYVPGDSDYQPER